MSARLRGRSPRRIVEGAVVAAALSGTPSTVHALATGGSITAASTYVLEATEAIGELLPPFQPDVVRGALAHTAISAGAAVALAAVLPRRHSTAWGAVAGLLLGIVNVGVIGRRFPHISQLPIGPQLADNIAYGALFAAVADRGIKSGRL